jgi:hypothetical protein
MSMGLFFQTREVFLAGVLGSYSGIVQQHLIRCEEGEVVVSCGGDDDMIHGIFVSVSLAIDEWLGEPGGIDRDRRSEIKEDDFSFGQRDAL